MCPDDMSVASDFSENSKTCRTWQVQLLKNVQGRSVEVKSSTKIIPYTIIHEDGMGDLPF